MFSRKILNRNYVKYLVTKIDENSNWKIHIHDLASKLNRSNSVLSRLRHLVSSEILRSVFWQLKTENSLEKITTFFK